MKILRLRFSNLNSLEGTWDIDFTDPAFTHHGLYLITGPTGSGKTTILDAMALALYGRTPRLSRVCKSDNDIMTRGCAQCSSEVLFQTTKGTFLATFAQRRARNNPQGALQDPKREIANHLTHDILASSIKECDSKIVEITSLPFEQFTRSVMLAQGQFAAFLQAGSNDRSPILEQITGTAIYSDISIATYRRYKEESETYLRLKASIDSYQLMDSKQLEELQDTLSQLEQSSKTLLQEIDKVHLAKSWFAHQQTLAQRDTALKQEQLSLEERQQEFLNDAQRLADHDRVSHLIAPQTKLQELRNDKTSSQTRLQQTQRRADDAKSLLLKAGSDLQTAKQHHEQLVASDKELAARIKTVEELDTRTGVKQASFNLLLQNLAKALETRHTLQREILDIKNTIVQREAEATKASTFLSTHEHLKDLGAKLTLLLEKLDSLQAEQANHKALASRLEETLLELEQAASYMQGRAATLQTEKDNLDLCSSRCKQFDVDIQSLQTTKDGRPLATAINDAKTKLQTIQAQSSRYLQLLADNATKAEFEVQLEETRTSLAETTKEIKVQTQLIDTSERLRLSYIENDTLRSYHKQLEVGKNCPLCNSVVQEIVPCPEADQDRIKKVEQDLLATRTLYATLLSRQGAGDEKLNALTFDTASLKAAINGHLSYFTDLGYETNDLQLLDDSLNQQIETCQQTLDQLNCDSERLDSLTEERQLEYTLKDKLYDSYLAADKAYTDATTRYGNVKLAASTLQASVESSSQSLTSMKSWLSQQYTLLAIEETATDMSLYLTDLAQRYAQAKALIDTLDNETLLDTTRIEEKTNHLNHNENELQSLRQEYYQEVPVLIRLKKERQELFGDRVCAVEKQASENTLMASLDDVNNKQELYQQASNEQTVAQTQLENDTTALADLTSRILNESGQFEAALQALEIAHEGQFLSMVLDAYELTALRKQCETLKQKGIELATRLDSLSQDVQDSKEGRPIAPYDEPASLETMLEALQRELQANQEQTGSIKQQLDDDEQRKESQKSAFKECEAQRAVLDIWTSLNDLIGSADGKKFRNFAQGITFDQLLSHANQQLRKMTDRYLLIRSQEESLGICVIDNYNAAQLRSTKNLSGGESFLISLALALGLARMSSKQIQVDSLFLDEGFGTLDSETLDTAIDVLASLHESGKSIGLISHVTDLKDRIQTQITVNKLNGGRSSIQGPGCCNISQ